MMRSRPALILSALFCTLSIPGCGTPERAQVLVETITRQTAVPDSGAGAGVEGGRETFLLGAHTTLRLRPDSLEVESLETRLEPPEAEGGEPVRRSTAVHAYHDFTDASLWVSVDGSPFERRMLDEIAYEEANRLRREAMDFSAAFVHSSRVRENRDVDLCWGDLRVKDTGRTVSTGQGAARVVQVAAEPGEVWEAQVAADASLLSGPGERERSLLGALGLSLERSRRLLDRLGGMPVKITARRLVPEESALIVTEHLLQTFRREALSGEAERSPSPGAPSSSDRESARRLDADLAGAAAILELLRALDAGERDPPRLATPLGLFLRLRGCLRPEELDDVLSLCRRLSDPFSQVELARAALKCDARRAWPALRAITAGGDAGRAMNVAEALVAEGHESAVPAIFHILGKREEYTDVERDAVVLWGLQHLRVITGLQLADLASRLPQPREGEALDAGEALAAELDQWLRWWEGARGRYPRW